MRRLVRVKNMGSVLVGEYSVLIVGNASFYYTNRIRELYHNAGIKLSYLLPHSPNRRILYRA